MPNTVVKLINAESTWLEAAWEDRKLLIKKERDTQKCVSFFVVSEREGRTAERGFLYRWEKRLMGAETSTGASFCMSACRDSGLMITFIYWKRRDRMSLQLTTVP